MLPEICELLQTTAFPPFIGNNAGDAYSAVIRKYRIV